MVAALVVEQTAYLLNIGDSRAYHINEDGITRLTRDHSVVEDMVARGTSLRRRPATTRGRT